MSPTGCKLLNFQHLSVKTLERYFQKHTTWQKLKCVMQWCSKAKLQYLLGPSVRLFLHPAVSITKRDDLLKAHQSSAENILTFFWTLPAV